MVAARATSRSTSTSPTAVQGLTPVRKASSLAHRLPRPAIRRWSEQRTHQGGAGSEPTRRTASSRSQSSRSGSGPRCPTRSCSRSVATRSRSCSPDAVDGAVVVEREDQPHVRLDASGQPPAGGEGRPRPVHPDGLCRVAGGESSVAESRSAGACRGCRGRAPHVPHVAGGEPGTRKSRAHDGATDELAVQPPGELPDAVSLGHPSSLTSGAEASAASTARADLDGCLVDDAAGAVAVASAPRPR